MAREPYLSGRHSANGPAMIQRCVPLKRTQAPSEQARARAGAMAFVDAFARALMARAGDATSGGASRWRRRRAGAHVCGRDGVRRRLRARGRGARRHPAVIQLCIKGRRWRTPVDELYPSSGDRACARRTACKQQPTLAIRCSQHAVSLHVFMRTHRLNSTEAKKEGCQTTQRSKRGRRRQTPREQVEKGSAQGAARKILRVAALHARVVNRRSGGNVSGPRAHIARRSECACSPQAIQRGKMAATPHGLAPKCGKRDATKKEEGKTKAKPPTSPDRLAACSPG